MQNAPWCTGNTGRFDLICTAFVYLNEARKMASASASDRGTGSRE
jgi:hypothetical protein